MLFNLLSLRSPVGRRRCGVEQTFSRWGGPLRQRWSRTGRRRGRRCGLCGRQAERPGAQGRLPCERGPAGTLFAIAQQIQLGPTSPRRFRSRRRRTVWRRRRAPSRTTWETRYAANGLGYLPGGVFTVSPDSSSQSTFLPLNGPTQVRNNLVRDVIRYMLFTNPRTKDAPVPKSELTSIVSKISKVPSAYNWTRLSLKHAPPPPLTPRRAPPSHRQERGLGDVVIRSVQLQLLEKFGIEMVELTKRKKAQKVGKGAQGAPPPLPLIPPPLSPPPAPPQG